MQRRRSSESGHFLSRSLQSSVALVVLLALRQLFFYLRSLVQVLGICPAFEVPGFLAMHTSLGRSLATTAGSCEPAHFPTYTKYFCGAAQ